MAIYLSKISTRVFDSLLGMTAADIRHDFWHQETVRSDTGPSRIHVPHRIITA